jgi:hypothetical protein
MGLRKLWPKWGHSEITEANFHHRDTENTKLKDHGIENRLAQVAPAILTPEFCILNSVF